MNKKLAIISAYNYNYGTVLQAVALVKVVSRYVNDVTVLQYKKKISFQQIKRIVNCSLLKSKIKAMIKKCYYILIHLIDTICVKRMKNFLFF